MLINHVQIGVKHRYQDGEKVGISLGFADADHRSGRIDIWSGNLVKVEYIMRKEIPLSRNSCFRISYSSM